MSYDHWNNLPKDVLIDVVQRLSSREDYYRFTAVCKSWNSAASEGVASLADSVIAEKPWWLLLRFPTTPMLLLAEEVAPGSILYDTEFDLIEDYAYDEEGYYKVNDDDNLGSYDYSKNSVGTSRGLYSLSSMRTYNIELPEAAGKLILSTSKGWLLTLGRDLEINLLHPLLRRQISLPPMLTFPCNEYNERYTSEDASEHFIRKVAMSSKLPNKNNNVSFSNHHATPLPTLMVIYHDQGFLGFARMGDQVWTDVDVSSDCFQDIVYHKGNFYAVNGQGDVYVCYDDHQERGWPRPRAAKIASIFVTYYNEQKYLVEPLSGSGLLLLVRHDREKLVKRGFGRPSKYRTTDFDVWRLDLEYCDSRQIHTCTVTREINNLENEAIFVGIASSFSVPSSDIIKPNCIYFTDDNWEAFFRLGGGHDMGIFDLEHRTVELHYPGKSIHCISPPLWYI